MKRFILSLALIAAAGSAQAAPSNVILADKEVQGIYRGSKAKFGSCEKLDAEDITVEPCDGSEDSTCEFSVSYWCRVSDDTYQSTRIEGTFNARGVWLDNMQFGIAVED